MSQESKDRHAQEIGLANNAFGAAAGTVATVQARNALKRNAARYAGDPAAAHAAQMSTRTGRLLARTKVNPLKAVTIAGGVNIAGQALNGLLDAQSAHYFARERFGHRKPSTETTEKGLAMSRFEGQSNGVGRRITEPTRAEVAKRSFDPEADRQRRTGLATGLLGGSAIVAGNAAARNSRIKGRIPTKNGAGALRLVANRRGAAALGATAALTAAAAGTYKHGVSERNKPWT